MTEHRETVPYTRESAVADVVAFVQKDAGSEEVQEDAELLVSRLMELGRAEELHDSNIRHRGYEIDSKMFFLELRVEDRRNWYRHGLLFLGSICVGMFGGYLAGGPLEHLVIIGSALFLIFGGLTWWHRRRVQQRLVEGIEKLRPFFEYASRLVDIGKITETQREELNKVVIAARAVLVQAEKFTKK